MKSYCRKLGRVIILTSVLGIFLCASMWAQDGKQWVTYAGGEGPGKGKHIVLLSGDEEYRSEEALPALAKILAYRHGFKCTVLFAIHPETGEIDPDYQQNIPGMEQLKTADLVIMLLRFRALPQEQMTYFLDYLHSGKPIMGLRTSTHAFRYPKNSPYFKYSFDSDLAGWEGGFGRQVLGETWISHHGDHGKESTQGLINGLVEDHPVLKGVTNVWGPTDVYGIEDITGEETVLLYGQALQGMKPGSMPNFSKSVLPVAWVKEYQTESGKNSRIFNTTLGAAVDMENEGVRRLLTNAAYWCLEIPVPEEMNTNPMGTFRPTFFGFGEARKGMVPGDFILEKKAADSLLQVEGH